MIEWMKALLWRIDYWFSPRPVDDTTSVEQACIANGDLTAAVLLAAQRKQEEDKGYGQNIHFEPFNPDFVKPEGPYRDVGEPEKTKMDTSWYIRETDH